MLATILKSNIATQTTIQIIETFSKLREFASTYKDITDRLESIEKTIRIDQQHLNFNTDRIDKAFDLLHQILKDTEKTNKNLIGFRPR